MYGTFKNAVACDERSLRRIPCVNAGGIVAVFAQNKLLHIFFASSASEAVGNKFSVRPKRRVVIQKNGRIVFAGIHACALSARF